MSARILDRIQESAWGKLHADYCWNIIEWQGDYLCWKVQKRYSNPMPTEKRGSVKGFSRSSRLRLMKSFAKIDIGENMPYLFMTLTYPDTTRQRDRWTEMTAKKAMDKENYRCLEYLNITQHRWVFWRYLERYLGKKLPGIWRIEWKERQTGVFAGFPMPHVHILLANCSYVPWQEVRWMWMNTLGERFVNIDVRAVYDPELVITYISKYLGKDEIGTLEYDAYIDSVPCGRSWGYMRKNLIVESDKWTGRYFETDDLASLRHYAVPGGVELIDAGMCSFTIIGKRAREIGEIIVGMDLDGQLYMQ